MHRQQLLRYVRIGACLLLAVGLSFVPAPAPFDQGDGGGVVVVQQAAMRLLAVFVATISALLLTDLPIAVACAFALSVLIATHSLSCTVHDGRQVDCSQCASSMNATSSTGGEDCTGGVSSCVFRTAMSGFADEVNWLVFAAFHIGKGDPYCFSLIISHFKHDVMYTFITYTLH